MKFIEKTVLVMFSAVVLVLSVIMCLLIFGWLEISLITTTLEGITIGGALSNIVLAVSALFIILALICIFFSSGSSNEENNKDGILLQNDNGKLLISKDTLENLIASIVKSFDGADIVSSKISLDKDNNLRVFVTMCVTPDAVIKDLTNNLQVKIKEAIKQSSDLDVKEVNVKVKNIVAKKVEIQE